MKTLLTKIASGSIVPSIAPIVTVVTTGYEIYKIIDSSHKANKGPIEKLLKEINVFK